MKIPRIIHPFLFAIFPLISLFSHNIAELPIISPDSINLICNPAIIAIFFVILFLVIFTIILKDSYKAAILVSVAIIIFFSYGHLIKIISKSIGLDICFLSEESKFVFLKYYISICAVLLVFIAYILYRFFSNIFALTRIFNIISITLLIIPFINIICYGIGRIHFSHIFDNGKIEISENNVKAINRLPDIYYIILDGYCSDEVLNNYYHYNNQEFINFLKKKNFYIASKSKSNYAFTLLSVASSLNFEYLDRLNKKLGSSKDLTIPLKMIRNNKTSRFLKTKGYKFIHMGCFTSERYSGIFVDLLIQTTMAEPFLSRFGYDRFTDKRNYVFYQFSRLAQLHKMKEPFFVYAHILLPHSPYVFGANGEKIAKEDNCSEEEINAYYVNQVSYVNKQVEKLVEEILSNSDRSPVIILQADHGQGNNRVARMSILNAYYFPEGEDKALYEHITPVNTFRIILNRYFGTDYKLLDDHSYFSWWGPSEKPYNFIDVTGELTNN